MTPTAENDAPECIGCLCPIEHDGDYGASGHPGPCPPHTCVMPTRKDCQCTAEKDTCPDLNGCRRLGLRCVDCLPRRLWCDLCVARDLCDNGCEDPDLDTDGEPVEGYDDLSLCIAARAGEDMGRGLGGQEGRWYSMEDLSEDWLLGCSIEHPGKPEAIASCYERNGF